MPSAFVLRTSAVFTPLAQAGYAGKSAITAITAAGGASTTIDEVVCSAIEVPYVRLVDHGSLPESSERTGYRRPVRRR